MKFPTKKVTPPLKHSAALSSWASKLIQLHFLPKFQKWYNYTFLLSFKNDSVTLSSYKVALRFVAPLVHPASSLHLFFLVLRSASSFNFFATRLLLRSAFSLYFFIPRLRHTSASSLWFFALLLHFTASICFFAPSLPSDSSLHFLSLLSPACFCERHVRIFNISAFSELDTKGTVLSDCGNCEIRGVTFWIFYSRR